MVKWTKRRLGMVDTEEIFLQIQSLPVDAQRTFIERVVRALRDELGKRPRSPEDPFLGLLADEPELADEIHRIATMARHEGREAFGGDENPS
jgi:hypothetical protein